ITRRRRDRESASEHRGYHGFAKPRRTRLFPPDDETARAAILGLAGSGYEGTRRGSHPLRPLPDDRRHPVAAADSPGEEQRKSVRHLFGIGDDKSGAARRSVRRTGPRYQSGSRAQEIAGYSAGSAESSFSRGSRLRSSKAAE